MHGNAKMTGGCLMKKDLTYNKVGKIVSKKMSAMAKKEMRLQNAGYITTKGVFGVKKMSGGAKVDDLDEKKTYILTKNGEKSLIIYIVRKNRTNIIYNLDCNFKKMDPINFNMKYRVWKVLDLDTKLEEYNSIKNDKIKPLINDLGLYNLALKAISGKIFNNINKIKKKDDLLDWYKEKIFMIIENLDNAKLNNKDPNYYEKFITGYSIKNKL